MKSTYLLLVAASLLFVLGCGQCTDATDTTTCTTSVSTDCQSTPRSGELIISLKPGLTAKDLTGDGGRAFVCYQNEDDLYEDSRDLAQNPRRERKDRLRRKKALVHSRKPFDEGKCEQQLITDTGEKALLTELNKLLSMNEQLDSVVIIDTCNCNLILLQLYPAIIPDIENKVAKGSSDAEEQNNGLIGSMGLNYNILPAPIASTPLQPITNPDSICRTYVYEGGDGSTIPNDSDTATDSGNEGVSSRESIICPQEIVDLQGIANEINSNDPIVRVAVIDTGVDPFYKYRPTQTGNGVFNTSFSYTNEEFAEVFNAGTAGVSSYGAMISGDAVDNDGICVLNNYFGYDYADGDNNPSDLQGHGTHVAGIIMTADSATDHHVRVMPLKFGGQDADGNFECSLFAGICAIDYATKKKADIINMSWGFYAGRPHGPLRRQLQIAADNNILLVASVGNDGLNIDGQCQHWPSNFVDDIPDRMISVAALDPIVNVPPFNVANYSNTGEHTDLAAPGSEIYSAKIGTGNRTFFLSGTSMAAAVISRRAAMLRYVASSGIRVDATTLKQLIMVETIENKNACTLSNRVYDHRKDKTLKTSTDRY